MHPNNSNSYYSGYIRSMEQISDTLDSIQSKIVRIDRRPLPSRVGDGSNIGRFHARKRVDFAKCAGQLAEVADSLMALTIYPGSNSEDGRDLYSRYEALWVVLIQQMSTVDADAACQLRKLFLSSGNRSYAAWVLVSWATFWGSLRNA